MNIEVCLFCMFETGYEIWRVYSEQFGGFDYDSYDGQNHSENSILSPIAGRIVKQRFATDQFLFCLLLVKANLWPLINEDGYCYRH